MKKYFYLSIVLMLGVLISSCDTTETDPDEIDRGSIFIQSVPPGAQIWVDNNNTGKVAPDSVANLSEGNHEVRLVLAGYKDTTFTVNVTAGLQTSRAITLVSISQRYGPVRIYETIGTTAQQPSGLDLSTGNAISVSDPDADIKYESLGFVIMTESPRNTVFYLSTGTDLNDGEDSPLAQNSGQGGWTDRVQDNVTNYFFLFDADLRYSKMKIVDTGGGVPGDPAWVEVEWIYNETENNRTF